MSSRIDPHCRGAGAGAGDVRDRRRGSAVLAGVRRVDGRVDVRVFGGVDVDPGDVADDAAGLESALVARSRGAVPGRVRAVHRPQVQLVTTRTIHTVRAATANRRSAPSSPPPARRRRESRDRRATRWSRRHQNLERLAVVHRRCPPRPTTTVRRCNAAGNRPTPSGPPRASRPAPRCCKSANSNWPLLTYESPKWPDEPTHPAEHRVCRSLSPAAPPRGTRNSHAVGDAVPLLGYRVFPVDVASPAVRPWSARRRADPPCPFLA